MAGFLNPEEILKEIELNPNMVAADFGCGAGGFTIALAKRLNQGLIYALDIQKEALSVLKSRCLFQKINNVNPVFADLEKGRIPGIFDNSLDLVFIINLLFQVDRKDAIILESKRVLKKGGNLIIVEWLPEKLNFFFENGGISIERLKEIIKKTGGLAIKKKFMPGECHYGLVFEKL